MSDQDITTILGATLFKFQLRLAHPRSSGYVYVTDTAYNRVIKYDKNGSFITQWYGPANASLLYPCDIEIDSSGYVYVADSGNHRIQKFGGNGTFITKWPSSGTSPGTGNGQFNYPTGVAVDLSGNVYVADQGNHRIQKFDSNGNFITKWGSPGSGDGQFNYPTDVAVDSAGYVYVCDSGNNRIQKFDGGGNFITKWSSQFNLPLGLGLAQSGNVYVADTDNHRIQKFSPSPLLPAAPTNLTATPAGSNRITLSWQDNSSNELGFKIKRKMGVRGQYSTIATVSANVKSYTDTNAPDNNSYYYAVWAYNNQGESEHSNEALAYKVNVRLLSPNGGEVIPSGSTYTIMWETVGAVNSTLRYKLQYSPDAGSNWILIADNLTGTSYNWTVPKPALNLSTCLVWVAAYDPYYGTTVLGSDLSDRVFSIEVVRVLSPNGGEILKSGTTYTITWQTNGTVRPVASVRLLYSINGGVTWNLISDITGNPGSYAWKVPSVSVVQSNCRVRVNLRDSNTITVGIDNSDNNFTIQP